MLSSPPLPVALASGRTGELIVPPGSPQMPKHGLIRFPDGKVHWIVATAIKEVPRCH